MASFLDYLKNQLEGTDPSQAAAIPVQNAQPQAQMYAGPNGSGQAPDTATAPTAPPVIPQDTNGNAVITAPPADGGVVDPNTINVTAHATPSTSSGVQLAMPKTQADVPDPQPGDRVKGDDVPPNYTPAEMSSSKTPMDDNGDPIEHKGAYGQHGTLRKIMGTLGDALLVGTGHQAQYAPKVQQEKESDALVGFAQNPVAAIGRLAAVNPKAGIALQSQVVNQELSQGRINQASQKVGASQTAAAFKVYGQIANAAAQAGNDPSKLAQANANVAALRQRAGLTADDLPDLTPQTAGVAAMSYTPSVIQKQQQMTEKQQNDTANQGIRQQSADAATSNAASHDYTAHHPQGRAAPNPTDASLAAPILAKITKGQTLSSGEQEVLTRLGKGITGKAKGSGSGLPVVGGTSTPPAAPANPKFSTAPIAYKANGWGYDAQGHPVRKLN